MAVAPNVSQPAADEREAARGFIWGGWILAAVVLLAPSVRAAVHRELGAADLAASTAAGLTLTGLAIALQGRLLFGGTLRRQVSRANGAAAVALAANHAALAVIVARAVAGATRAELPASLAFSGLGLVTWALFVALFRLVTTYSDAQEIAGENHAAAVSYAGAALALAILIAHAIDGPFAGWGRSLRAYAAALATAVCLYPTRQLIVEGVLLGQRPRLRGGELDRAIGQRRSVGIAAVEAAAYVGTAWLATGLW